MEKTIHIDGRDVPFKSTAGIAKRYKAQFGRDVFATLAKLEKALPKEKDGKPDLENTDFEVFYDLAWTLAKTADKTIPNPQDWLDEFEEFPILEIFTELKDLIEHTIRGKKK